MAIPSRPARGNPRPPSAAAGSGQRAAWLVLASDGPATDVAIHAPATVVRVVDDPRRFRDLLLAERPRVVVCAQPPAGATDLELVVRERRHRPGLRAVHLSEPEAVVARLGALALGFDDAVTTAIPAAELAGRIGWLEHLVRGTRHSGTEVPVADGLVLDLAGRRLRRGTLSVHLRPKELGLLALLATHPGRAYTRSELLRRVWGRDGPDGVRTVDVHVRWLRSKIEGDPQRPVHLVTVRGVGYRLDPPSR